MRALALAALLIAVPAGAHLNSPHAYRETRIAGHDAVVVVHLPRSVPGEAEAQLRLLDLGPDENPEVSFRQIPPQGEGHAPEWTPAHRSPADRAHWTAPMPLMVFGMFEAEFRVKTAAGEGSVRVPLTARNPTPRRMDAGLVATLSALSLFLVGTAFLVVRAVIADAGRDPVLPRRPSESRAGLVAGLAASAGFAGFLGFTGYTWQAMHRNFVARTAPALDAQWLVKSGTPRVGHPVDAVVLLTSRDGSPATELLEENGESVHVTFVDTPEARHVAHVHGIATSPGTYELTWIPRVPGRHVVFVDASTREAGDLTIVQEIIVGPAFGEAPAAMPAALPPPPLPPLGEAVGGGGMQDAGNGIRAAWPAVTKVRAGDVVTLQPELSVPAAGAEILVLRDDLQVFDRLRPSAPGTLRFASGFPQPGRYRLVLVAPGPSGGATSALDVVVGS